MFDKPIKWLMILVLSLAILQGAYLGLQKYKVEAKAKNIELCVDLNDLKTIAAYEKKPLTPILEEINKLGITAIGVFEETLPDAIAQGEVSYVKGSALWEAIKFNPKFAQLSVETKISPLSTYIHVPDNIIRKRLSDQLTWALGQNNVQEINEVLCVNEAEESIRSLGLGFSESQISFLKQKGFKIIPRILNDPRYHLGNIGLKIAGLKGYGLIIFDGEEILGYPDAIAPLAKAMQTNNIKYGYIEIVKQDGDLQLKKLMQENVVRVHSVPKDELKKISKDEAITRFARAARERGVNLIYLRPFLPPKVDAYPVAFNLSYFRELTSSLKNAGFTLGQDNDIEKIELGFWQVTLLGAGVVVGAIFLANYFMAIPAMLSLALLLVSSVLFFNLNLLGFQLQLQKLLAFLCVVIFPCLAIIDTFSKSPKPRSFYWDSLFLVFNVVAQTVMGIFLLVGLFTDYRFMMGIETFGGVKFAYVLPMMIIALYFILQQDKGSAVDKIKAFLNTEIKLITLAIGLFVLAALGVLVARSGNFILPVPGFEKIFRNLLETLLFIRPRTKEFLVGYPILFICAVYYLRNQKQWLWILAALSAIAPISAMNTFCHAHTPIMVSMVRSFNGLELGLIIGLFAAYIYNWQLDRQ